MDCSIDQWGQLIPVGHPQLLADGDHYHYHYHYRYCYGHFVEAILFGDTVDDSNADPFAPMTLEQASPKKQKL
jgi:hypothetical protein